MSKDVYIFSTLTADQIYPVYQKTEDLPAVAGEVFIKGGANMPGDGKNVPPGAVTKVTAEQLEMLEKSPGFIQHRDNGYIIVSKSKVDPEVVAADMTSRDASAPLTQEDVASLAPSAATAVAHTNDGTIDTASTAAISQPAAAPAPAPVRPGNPRRA